MVSQISQHAVLSNEMGGLKIDYFYKTKLLGNCFQ